MRRRQKYATVAAIDQPGVHVIVNPGGTNERFDRAHLQKATIIRWSDNATIFDALVEGKADLMITDAVETRVQAKLHPGVLCPVHPDAPFDRSELAYWMPRDPISRLMSINGSTCSIFRASIRRSSPDGCPEHIYDQRSVAPLGLVQQQGRVIQRLAEIGLLFDRDKLDLAAVHLHGLTNFLSNQLMGKRRHVGD